MLQTGTITYKVKLSPALRGSQNTHRIPQMIAEFNSVMATTGQEDYAPDNSHYERNKNNLAVIFKIQTLSRLKKKRNKKVRHRT